MSKKLGKKYQYTLLGLLFAAFAGLLAFYLLNHSIAVLSPKGLIASKERNLIIIASLVSLIVVIPVFVMTFFIAWRYRASNTKATYHPDWDHNIKLETVWWLVPFILILVLSVITWNSSHQLDPSKPLGGDTRPMTIQVVALQWKWLFIYPDENIATVNYVRFPVNKPINFEITADAPMNSFWIPQLGSQIYAMSGMSTHLHLMANELGSFNGSSANISGRGFAGMKFIAESTSDENFNNWIQSVKRSPTTLTMDEYNNLALPSENNPLAYYSSPERGLYNEILVKFMRPITGNSGG